MAIPKFPFRPEQRSYTISYSDGLISTVLDGGDPRSRLDIAGAPHTVSATFVLRSEAEFDRFQGAMRAIARTGGAPVTMDLSIDAALPEKYEVRFVPGSIQLSSVVRPMFIVTASLIVKSLNKYLDPDTDPYVSLEALTEAYGQESILRDVMTRLQTLANVDLPHA